jgi:hypothetical protein
MAVKNNQRMGPQEPGFDPAEVIKALFLEVAHSHQMLHEAAESLPKKQAEGIRRHIEEFDAGMWRGARGGA